MPWDLIHHAASALNEVQGAIPVAAALLLAAAALHDVALRIIPNVIPLALLAIGLVLRLGDGSILPGLAFAAAVFAAAFACWRRGWMGGGDVKLLAATAFVVPPFLVGSFLVLTAQAGGVLAVLYLVLSRTVRLPPRGRRPPAHNLLARILRAERWRICRGAPLPYGFAIAAGGITFLLK